MGTSKQTIQINAEIKASLSGMDKVVSDLEEGLKKQKYDLSKNSGLAKLIKQYKNAKSEFDSLTELDKVGLGDVDKTTKAAQKVADIYKQLGKSFRQIQAGDIDIFKKLFPDNFSAKIEKGNKAINQYFKKIEEKSTKESRAQILEKDLERLKTTLSTLENKRIKAEVEIDISKAQEKLKKLQEERKNFLEDFSKSITPKEVKDSSGKIYDKANIQAQIEAAEKEVKDKENKAKNLEKRKLSQQELDEIERLKEGYEGVDFKRQQKAAQDALKKYRDEASARDLAQNEGIVDKGRSRRTFGNLTDEELEERIIDKQQELIKLEKKEKQHKDKIAKIKAKPEQEFKQQKKQANAEVSTAKTKLENANKELETYQKLKAAQEEVIKQKTADFESGKDNTGVRQEDIDKLKQYDDTIQETTRSLKKLNEEKTYSNQAEKDDVTSKKKSEIDKKKLELQTLQNSIKELTEATNIDEVFKKLEELNLPLKDIEHSSEGLQKLKKELKELDSNTVETIRQSLKQIGFTAEETEGIIKQLDNGLDKLDLEKVNITKTNQDIENLKNQVLDFFSITNTIQIFKNAVRDAFDTVKELDAVMTETAVVTDFSIGDMWEKLPEYSDEANKLGTSISSLYEATTLYYQQGLKSQEAMDIGIETMKMARIANMDAAAATEAMTAALRGFNMEINETNATRINDVYSELAAITAADTEQIATAMSKTASIADAANMEFETTAAFLAQIIETTQEAPETAGTAMKTIIARFTEVKELFDEGMLSGKDAEGEEININKIDAALKKVGISLNDFLRGEKGIDDIFLELASKWNTLDLATQRYIATTAAGSRQQSRFLAMMGNYDRTMELVTAANNSAGASQKQFDKTLESLEAKLQRLNNAWQEFTMGLANNEAIKAGVDLLTWLLETINKITGVAGNEGLGGVVTMFARLATVIGALKGGGAIIKNLISSMVKTGVFSKNILGIMGLDETGNWVKDISLMKILMNTLNITAEKSHILFGKLGIAVTKAATGFKLAGAEGAVAGAAVTIGWLPVVGIIAGIIAVVWALVAVFKAAHAASPEGKLEAASAAADGAAEAAENAAQAYEHLASALDSINGKSGALENLAVGTTEWKNAVQELNGEVLDLVEQYPELAKFVDSSRDYLSFTDKEVDGKTVTDVLETYQNNKFKAQSASAAAKLQKQQAQIDLDYSKLDDNIKIIPKIDIPEYNSQYYSTQISQLQGGPYSAERAQKIATVQKEWSEVEKAYNEAKLKEANAQFSPDTRELTEKVAKAIASNQIEGNSIDEKTKNKTITVDGESYTFDDNNYEKLKEYGEGLVAADAATKVFTDSLLSNALMTAEVSEEQKSNMMNFLDSEQVNNQVDDMLNTITTNWTKLEERQQYKQDYADIMGYEYDKSKDRFLKDGQEVEVSDESVQRQMAGIKVQDELNNKMKAMNGILDNSITKNTDAGKMFENLTEKGEGAGLTFKQIEDFGKDKDGKWILNEDALANFYQANEQALVDIYGSKAGFIKYVSEAFGLAVNQKEKTTERAVQMRTSESEQLAIEKADLSSGVISNIIDGLYDVALASGNKAAQEVDKTLSNIMADMEPETAQKFAQAIGDLDWTDIKDVENLSNDLEDLGIASLFGEGEIDTLEQKIISLAKAARTFNADELKEAFEKSRSLAEEIRGREDTERTFTKEQMKQLIESGGAKAVDFVWTGEDEFTYIGGSMDTLSAALDANTAALLKETVDTANEEAWIAKKWQDNVDFQNQRQNEKYLTDFEKLASSDEKVRNYDEDSVTIDNMKYDKEWLVQSANLFGIGGEAGVPEDLGVEQLVTLITKAYAKYGSEVARQGFIDNAENLNATSGATAAYLQNATYVQQQMDEVSNGKVVQQKYDSESSEANAKALRTQAYEMGVNTSIIEQFNKALADNKGILDDSTAAILTNAIADKKATSNLTKTVKKVKEITDEYNNFNEVLDDDVQTIGESFGLTELQKDSKSFNFVKDNLDLIKKAVDGDVEAMQDFQGLLAQHMGVTVDATTGFVDLSAIINATDSVTQSAMAAMNALIKAGQFEIETVKVETSGTYDVPIVGANGLITGFSKQQYSAGQTMQVVKPVDAPQIKQATGSSGGSGGGGGGSEWKNPYDKLYNTQENIDRTIREREQIERRYQRLLDRRLATAQELYRTSQAEIDALREQAEYQQKMLAGRQEMLQEEMDKNKDLQKYATADIESGQITIDWDLINSVKDEEEGKRIEDYISKLEELRDSMHESQDAIEEINDSIWEIEDRGREEYMDLEERIKEAITENRQREIDTLEEINDSINEANEKLLDSIQQSIDKMRQDRENEKTEEDLQEKQRRLAYLEQDTSNANAMEILELRKEIKEGQEDYTDTLIDQKISELQEQNDKAAEQREKQITLLQNQLDWEIESGRIWAEVDELLKDGLNPQGGLIRGSKLEEVMKNGENWTGLSKIGQMDWLTDLETLIAQSMNWQITKGQLENLHDKLTGQTITFRNANGEIVSGKVDEEGKVVLDDGSYYKDVYQWIDGGYYTTEQNSVKPSSSNNSNDKDKDKNDKDKNNKDSVKYQAVAKFYQKTFTSYSTSQSGAEADAIYKAGAYKSSLIADATNKLNAAKAAKDDKGVNTYQGLINTLSAKSPELVSSKRYKTGGLADFTGPAWLDGTKSRPELVLNQRDTQNFIQLKDILSSIMSRNIPTTHTSTENNGDLSFDIDINVESLQSDYDVEQVASKVKSMIVDNARYRNNNAISLTR